jgi:hypothetical protein
VKNARLSQTKLTRSCRQTSCAGRKTCLDQLAHQAPLRLRYVVFRNVSLLLNRATRNNRSNMFLKILVCCFHAIVYSSIACKLPAIGGFLSSFALASCVSTPPLSEATGTEANNIFIKDVVQRVNASFPTLLTKIEQSEYRWLATWTAHADLTLTINDNAGISPTGSNTRFQGNGVNQDAGPSTFPRPRPGL